MEWKTREDAVRRVPKEGKETAQQKNPLEEKERKEKTKLWEFKRKGIIIGILREGKKRFQEKRS